MSRASFCTLRSASRKAGMPNPWPRGQDWPTMGPLMALPNVKTAVKSLSKSLLTWIKCLTLPFVVVLALLHRSEVALNVKYCFNQTFCLNQEEIKYIFFAFPPCSLYCRDHGIWKTWGSDVFHLSLRLVAHGQFQNMFFLHLKEGKYLCTKKSTS